MTEFEPHPDRSGSPWNLSHRGIVATRLALAFITTGLVLPYCWARVYVMTFLADQPEKRFAVWLALGVACVMKKPFDVHEFAQQVRGALKS